MEVVVTNPAAQAEHAPAAQAEHAPAAVHEVEIVVNKRPVKVPARTTGAAIKASAGVPAEDQLFKVEGNKEVEIGDDEPIQVHNGERFVATRCWIPRRFSSPGSCSPPSLPVTVS